MKVIIKGRLSKEYLKYAAIQVQRILDEHAYTEEEIKMQEQKHKRIVAMVDELGIVDQKERQEMCYRIVDKEEDEQLMRMWVDGYWEGERVVCDLEVAKDYKDIVERTKMLFYED